MVEGSLISVIKMAGVQFAGAGRARSVCVLNRSDSGAVQMVTIIYVLAEGTWNKEVRTGNVERRTKKAEEWRGRSRTLQEKEVRTESPNF